jgi:hypothetical protein
VKTGSNYRKIFAIGLFLVILILSCCANESRIVLAKSPALAKLELQPLKDSDIPFSGCSCSVTDRQNRMIFIAESGTDDAFIKIDGRVIKLQQIKNSKPVGGLPQPKKNRYRGKDLELSIDYGRGKSGGYESTKFDRVKFNVVYKGQKLNIATHGDCGC